MVKDLDILKDKLEAHLRELREINLDEEQNTEIYVNILFSRVRLKRAIRYIREKQSPEECISPICNSTDVRYPSHDPRYCLDCYREKAS